ncbi:MAG: cytoplasmic protein [Pseudomonadota bacterium]|nr:cytoplasmic protein [Desulfobacterales bacterium]MBU0699206.1 cytoplasmic protein [Pseudomonadota bacterium]
MPSNEQQQQIDFTVDRNHLYREESFTDIKVAAIRRLIPVKPDGSNDDSRFPIFMGQTQLITPKGPVMLQSLLKAQTIEEAMDEFPAAMQAQMDKMIADAMERQVRENK